MPDRQTMNTTETIAALTAANDVARRSKAVGKHPFGAVLIGPEGEILLEQGNVSTVVHAESELARRAAEMYSADFLWRCTLATNFEPCAMCAGTIYWANIGCVVYAASEASLLELTGAHPENPTLDLPCRSVFNAGQKAVVVIGPVTSMIEATLDLHRDFWS